MKLDQLIEKSSQKSKVTVAVAAAEDEEVLEAVVLAIEKKIANFLLYGDREKITNIMTKLNPNYLSHDYLHIFHTESKEQSAALAVQAVHTNDADVLMKGNLETSTILKAVLNKEYGLRTGSILSHVAVFEIPGFDRLTFITDAAMNIGPSLEQKVHILNNAVKIATNLGIELPKVAPIAAVETINPAMQATLDAAALTQMNRRGQIKNCIVDGPLALDNAVSLLAAEHKGISSDVAGRADILLVPTIEVGNALYKSLIYFAKAKVGAIIAGAKSPIVLTSRADTAESKLYSLALAVCSVK